MLHLAPSGRQDGLFSLGSTNLVGQPVKGAARRGRDGHVQDYEGAQGAVGTARQSELAAVSGWHPHMLRGFRGRGTLWWGRAEGLRGPAQVSRGQWGGRSGKACLCIPALARAWRVWAGLCLTPAVCLTAFSLPGSVSHSFFASPSPSVLVLLQLPTLIVSASAPAPLLSFFLSLL